MSVAFGKWWCSRFLSFKSILWILVWWSSMYAPCVSCHHNLFACDSSNTASLCIFYLFFYWPLCPACLTFHQPQTHGITTGGVCVPCHCNSFGSKSFDCDETGQCRCQPGVTGPKCDRCSRGFFNFQEGGCTRKERLYFVSDLQLKEWFTKCTCCHFHNYCEVKSFGVCKVNKKHQAKGRPALY